MKELGELQKFIDAHSRFTDSIIEELEFLQTDKGLNANMVIKPRFRGDRVDVEFRSITRMEIKNLNQYSIWELELKKNENVYIFAPSPISNLGNLYLEAKEIYFRERERDGQNHTHYKPSNP